MNTAEDIQVFTAKDLVTDQEVRWCPGCGDYSILKQVQKVLPELGRNREDFVFISGIGCASRFPYYMETYGMHSIHGRATAIATGLKASRPELSVWVITGDGDALSIGGNHLIHTLRRNPDLNILLFNNQIYGLTKGQFSPTSEEGKITKSSPYGTVDHPFNPLALCLGANGTFVARTMDRDPKHMQEMLKRSYYHSGTSLLEIYQNCNVFNDGAFELMTEKQTKAEHAIFVEHGKPLLFGENNTKGIKLDGTVPVVVDAAAVSHDELWIHDETDNTKAYILSRFFSNAYLPRPFGVLYAKPSETFENLINQQLHQVMARSGKGDLDTLLAGKNNWIVN